MPIRITHVTMAHAFVACLLRGGVFVPWSEVFALVQAALNSAQQAAFWESSASLKGGSQ